MIEYLEYKKKKYPIRIAYRALKGFQKETGVSFEEAQENFELEHLEVLLYYGMLAGAKVDEEELALKREDMEDVLDESMESFTHILQKFFPPDEKGAKPNRQQRRAIGKKA